MRKRLGLAVALLVLTVAAAAQDPSRRRNSAPSRWCWITLCSIWNTSSFRPPKPCRKINSDFAPTNGEFKGVRTFAQQIKHVAAVNYEIAAAILEQKAPVDINEESGPASITTKADILTYLKESFAYVHKAIATINEKNVVETVKSPFGEGSVSRMGLATSIAWHGYDHYGQMVVYLRMNGIVPPASMPSGK